MKRKIRRSKSDQAQEKRLTLSEKIIKWFQEFTWTHWTIYCIALFSLGRWIDCVTQYSFKNFIWHQLLLISATTLLMKAMKTFFKDVDSLKEDLTGGNWGIKSIYDKKLLGYQRSFWPFLISAVITVFFFTCIILLEYIYIDIIGIYAIYIAGSSVVIGAYAYTQYLFFLLFIYKAGKEPISKYDTYTPAESPWIKKLARISQTLRNYFLVIGLIYVIEYAILIPTDKIDFSDASFMMDTPNNAAFILSWIILFLLVIVAFPIINHAQCVLVCNLVNTCKRKTIQDLTELMAMETANKKKGTGVSTLNSVITYSVLIENVRKSKSYPIERRISFETVMTIITFFVHACSLYSKISSIPQLGGLLFQF